jgi:hypothetical protein
MSIDAKTLEPAVPDYPQTLGNQLATGTDQFPASCRRGYPAADFAAHQSLGAWRALNSAAEHRDVANFRISLA